MTAAISCAPGMRLEVTKNAPQMAIIQLGAGVPELLRGPRPLPGLAQERRCTLDIPARNHVLRNSLRWTQELDPGALLGTVIRNVPSDEGKCDDASHQTAEEGEAYSPGQRYRRSIALPLHIPAERARDVRSAGRVHDVAAGGAVRRVRTEGEGHNWMRSAGRITRKSQ
jgi:hypothetical protein